MAPAINLILDGNGAWPDLAGRDIIHVTDTIGVTVLEGGMQSGRPAVAIRLNLPDGRVVVAETSLRLFVAAARAAAARYPDDGSD